MGKLMLEGQ